jgi:hypothetical protein
LGCRPHSFSVFHRRLYEGQYFSAPFDLSLQNLARGVEKGKLKMIGETDEVCTAYKSAY